MKKIIPYLCILIYTNLSAQDSISWQQVSQGISYPNPKIIQTGYPHLLCRLVSKTSLGGKLGNEIMGSKTKG